MKKIKKIKIGFCKTCDSWNPEKCAEQDWGHCSFLSGFFETAKDGYPNAIFPDIEKTGIDSIPFSHPVFDYYTKDTFGCVHHSPKAQENITLTNKTERQ